MLTVLASASESGPSAATSTYPLDGSSAKYQTGDSRMNTQTKWEGVALLVSTLVSGPQSYTVMERWTRSRDGNTLTIKRTIIRPGRESESVLVYENPASPIQSPSSSQVAVSTPRQPERTARMIPNTPEVRNVPADYVVERGSRVLLRLTNSVNTKHTKAGDRVYLETAAPVFVDGQLVIPRGSYVIGTVTDSHQAGRVKGKSGLNLRFDSITLPNGVARDFRSRPGSVDTQGNLDRKEGTIEGESNKGGDARTIGKTTAAGTAVGAVAGGASGHLGMGAGIGAAAGAAAGLAGVLASRGPNVILPAGTTMELVLDRDLQYTASELRPRIQ